MKKIVRLTESDLHRIIKESVKRVLKEDAFGGVEKQENPAQFTWYSIGDNKGQRAHVECTLLDGKTESDVKRAINNKITGSYRFKDMRLKYEKFPGKYVYDERFVKIGSIKTGGFIDVWSDDDSSDGGGRFTTKAWADDF